MGLKPCVSCVSEHQVTFPESSEVVGKDANWNWECLRPCLNVKSPEFILEPHRKKGRNEKRKEGREGGKEEKGKKEERKMQAPLSPIRIFRLV